MIRKLLLALVGLLSLFGLASAQEGTVDETTQRVAATSEAFLDQILKEDFAAERAFLSPRLTQTISAEEWAAVRQQTIGLAGKTQRYSVHGITYYQEAALLAAVDFSGSAGVADALICGFLLWEVPDEGAPGLLRFEQNIVTIPAFRQMPVQEAAQTMVNWRCPKSLIERTLNLKLQ